ncbi:hypothetical protein [Streptomyces sp. Ac-502]|uniref:hypothetical protein n=1 Tax=Streptomyces sp. Ac-502 TaxID=3342801 RepID=UPI003862AF62
MTLVRMQPRSTNVTPAHQTAADAMDAGALQACDDMTIEVALSVMAGARTGHLVVCDIDGLRTQLVTRAQLTAVRHSPAYTDRIRLRDIFGGGPLTSPVATVAEAEHAVPGRRLAAVRVAEDQGSVRGVLALAH